MKAGFLMKKKRERERERETDGADTLYLYATGGKMEERGQV
jgi:hypothetical protein